MGKDQYGLIGKKIGHSLSAAYFNEKFKIEGIDAQYSLFPLATISEFSELIENTPNLKGLNVTIPYKQEVMPMLDEISDEAKGIGAVNVIKVSYNSGKPYLKGYNSDCIGFKNSLLPLLKTDMKKALILGTGGASKAVNYILKNLGLEVTFVSRSPQQGQLSYSGLTEEIIADNLLIVNTTPLGMFPNTETYAPIPYHYLTRKHLCYDLVYNPEETEFMKRSRAQGATVKNGMEMWLGQAIASWEFWNK